MSSGKNLLIKINAMGDVIMSLPLSVAMAKEADLTWVVGKSLKPLIKNFPHISKIIYVDEKKLFHGNFVQKLIEVFRVSLKIGFRKYKSIVIANNDWRYHLFALFSLGKRRKFLSRRDEKHHLSLLKTFDPSCEDTIKFPELNLDDITLEKFHLPSRFIALFPGGAKNTLRDVPHRRWSTEEAKIFISLSNNNDTPIVIMGAPSDEWLRAELKECKFIDLIGKTNVLEVIKICDQSLVSISNDSGPLHLAGLGKSPLIGLFGPTYEKEIMPEVHDKQVSIFRAQNLACAPCYNGREVAPHCVQNICMDMITADDLWKTVESLIK